MAWAKVHTDILGDEKFMRAARKGARHLLLVPWLIAFAKKADDDGRLSVGGEPAEPEDIADKCPATTAADVVACLDELEQLTKNVIKKDRDGTYRFLNWGKRQDKPSNSPESVRERVQRHRQRKRERERDSGTPDPEGTSETPKGRNANDVTPRNAIEGEVEGETEGEEKRRDSSDATHPASRIAATAAAEAERAEPVPEPTGRTTPLGRIAGAIRESWWAPDGKPPSDWGMGRELSIWRRILDARIRLDDCLAAIRGAAYLRNAGGTYGCAEPEQLPWLTEGDKLTGRVFNNTHAGAVPLWTLALDAYLRGPPAKVAARGRGLRQPAPLSALVHGSG